MKVLGRGTAWLDAGTHESLIQAATFIQTVEERQGMMISCPEEIAYRLGFINDEQLRRAGAGLENNSYGAYLLRLLDEPVSFSGVAKIEAHPHVGLRALCGP